MGSIPRVLNEAPAAAAFTLIFTEQPHLWELRPATTSTKPTKPGHKLFKRNTECMCYHSETLHFQADARAIYTPASLLENITEYSYPSTLLHMISPHPGPEILHLPRQFTLCSPFRAHLLTKCGKSHGGIVSCGCGLGGGSCAVHETRMNSSNTF